MIKLAEKFDVLHSHFVEGKGIKTIAREMSLSRNTVRSYLREYGAQKEEVIKGGDKSELLLAMNSAPTYDSSKRGRTAATDEVIEIISTCLMENENKRAIGNAKLCMKATDIYEHVVNKGFHISYPSVANYVRILKDIKQEAFIKQEYAYGEVCEFDWGETKLTISGKQTTFRMAVFTMAATNIRYAILCRQEDTQTFVDAHIRFFRFMGRVPHTMVYDNMRVAVAKFVGKNEKIATIALKQLSTYYGFGFRFCNIRKGNEKGHVERSVEFVRRKAFSGMSLFGSIEDAGARLFSTLERLNEDKKEYFEAEREAMLPKMPDYTSVIRQQGLVDKYSTITYKQNRYSVPDYLVGKEVEVLAFVDEIRVRFRGKELARHKRSYENHTFTLNIEHYRETLLRKPGALRNSLCLKQMNEGLQIIWKRFFADNPKEFIQTLDLLSEYSIYQLETAIDKLVASGARIQLDNIKMVLGNKPTVYEFAENNEIERACEAQLSGYMREAAV